MSVLMYPRFGRSLIFIVCMHAYLSVYLCFGQHITFYLFEFLQVAKRYVETALDYSKDIVIGNGPQGPFDHLLRLKSSVKSSCRQVGFNPSDLLLYAVTDSRMNQKWSRSITDAVKAAIEGGATIVQLRFVATCILFFSSCIIFSCTWVSVTSLCDSRSVMRDTPSLISLSLGIFVFRETK